MPTSLINPHDASRNRIRQGYKNLCTWNFAIISTLSHMANLYGGALYPHHYLTHDLVQIGLSYVESLTGPCGTLHC